MAVRHKAQMFKIPATQRQQLNGFSIPELTQQVTSTFEVSPGVEEVDKNIILIAYGRRFHPQKISVTNDNSSGIISLDISAVASSREAELPAVGASEIIAKLLELIDGDPQMSADFERWQKVRVLVEALP